METLQSKTHWKKSFNYDYLGAYSLPTTGEDIVLTIKETTREKVKNVKGEEQECFVLKFSEKGTKPMILNKTNAKTIQKVYGTPYIEDWVGKKIALYSTSVNAFGTETDALRIRAFKPQIKQIDITQATEKLNAATSLADLQEVYNNLPQEEKFNKELIAIVKELKTKLK